MKSPESKIAFDSVKLQILNTTDELDESRGLVATSTNLDRASQVT